MSQLNAKAQTQSSDIQENKMKNDDQDNTVGTSIAFWLWTFGWILMCQSGWGSGVLPHLPPQGPHFESCRGHYVGWLFSPYLVIPGIILWGFPPTSKFETYVCSPYEICG